MFGGNSLSKCKRQETHSLYITNSRDDVIIHINKICPILCFSYLGNMVGS